MNTIRLVVYGPRGVAGTPSPPPSTQPRQRTPPSPFSPTATTTTAPSMAVKAFEGIPAVDPPLSTEEVEQRFAARQERVLEVKEAQEPAITAAASGEVDYEAFADDDVIREFPHEELESLNQLSKALMEKDNMKKDNTDKDKKKARKARRAPAPVNGNEFQSGPGASEDDWIVSESVVPTPRPSPAKRRRVDGA
uniref:Uncharacterized protein n=1 Tax=Mycena chlorophos TaxID=658473 RepID=A0ABQ0L5D5_MYCCL|nr:predicted protein [Mycena chlorophos]